MSLERGSGVAVWRQIESALTEDIRQQVFAAGERLPNETELAERFGVNRHTVRRALGVLERGGLIRVEQGRGTFVQDYAIDYTIGKRTRFSQNMASLGLASSMALLRTAELTAPSDIAKALGLRRGAKLVQIVTVGHAEGRPINISTSSFSAARFAGIGERVRELGSITRALAEYAVDDYTRGETKVTARLPDNETARVLSQARTRPVLQVESINFDSDGEPLQHSTACFSGDWVQLIFDPGV
ncbi:phosphonate metabolism transcriptional regulator PhnF [Niveibacterium sp. 24ML]|uniref:phosphonate metabolism transcriptional regulator PhnF n=1 Tax=Niveibacterium sp. 24ML TaxID=2985512 RepID=UPI00227073E3|nr:phosphonate metabolism transcriptional regulator PhnF [Niveibacterium sp. 24ML]MCX9156073.1 phosphonate metabolism transcriptional regulator PhnF [Niveibacterium sp. 24ML]